MKDFLRAGFGFALCFAVAACGDKPAPVADAAPPPPAEPAPQPMMSGMDGVYGGMRTRTAESGKSCSRSGHAMVHVMNGTVMYAPVKSQSFSAPIGADGSFTATEGDSTFAGTLADGKVTGTLDGSKCHYTLALSKTMMHGKHHMKHHHKM